MPKKQRRPFTLKRIPLNQIHDPERGGRLDLLPPLDDRLVALLQAFEPADGYYIATLPLAELGVHHPPTVDKIRAKLSEEPTLKASIVAAMRDSLEKRRRWPVYFDPEAKRFVMFDDYLAYVVATADGVEAVDDVVVGNLTP